jgi:hypothetical protein
MEFRRQSLLLIVALPLLAVAQVAMAENWQAVGTHSEVDADSIRIADDGFVHYMDRDPPRADDASATRESYEEAFDCAMMISYVGLDDPDWKANGHPVKPNSHGSELMDFVCSHLPAAEVAPEPPTEAPPAEPPVGN